MAFFDKDDIPGKNTFTPMEILWFRKEEELFCSGVVKNFSQPVGVIVAESQALADKASEMVEITYDESKDKPLLNVRDVLSASATDRIKDDQEVKPTKKG